MSLMIKEAEEASVRCRRALTLDRDLYAALGEKLRKMNPACVATIARGSSDHAATYANYLIPKCTGRVVASVAPSLVTVLDAPLDLKGQFALAISQSGSSPDILKTIERSRASGALTAALVNNVDSPLAKAAEVVLDQHAGPEVSVAATKTVLCTMFAIARIVAEWSQDPKLKVGLESLPDVMAQAFQRGMAADDQILGGVTHAYVLSRGLGLSSAVEMALKLKETCGIHAEAFSTAEVRHGPREIVDGKFLVLGIGIPGSGLEDVRAVTRELAEQGARVALFAPDEPGHSFPLSADPRLMPLVALQFMYPWLARSAKAIGRDPDRPKVLKSKIVNTF